MFFNSFDIPFFSTPPNTDSGFFYFITRFPTVSFDFIFFTCDFLNNSFG